MQYGIGDRKERKYIIVVTSEPAEKRLSTKENMIILPEREARRRLPGETDCGGA